jgi:RNA polymerase sigma-70 factor (ECF subfamily)
MVGYALEQRPGDEAELVERARRKDKAAVKSIIQQHNRRLYRIARSIVHDGGEAEDVLQEAYVRALSSLHSFRGEARLGTWLARIVINEARGRLRRYRPTVELDAVDTSPGSPAQIIAFPNVTPRLDPETTLAQREIFTLVERAIDEVPEAFRTVLIARLVEGMSTDETAELFGIAPETVKTRLHRARRLLKEKIEAQIGPVLGDAFPFAGQRCECLTSRVLVRLGLD